MGSPLAAPPQQLHRPLPSLAAMRRALASHSARRLSAAAAVPRRHAGFLSGLKNLVGGGDEKREFPSAAAAATAAAVKQQDGLDYKKMSGLELSKHQMLKQRGLEAAMVAAGEQEAEEKMTIPDDFKKSLLSTPMVSSSPLAAPFQTPQSRPDSAALSVLAGGEREAEHQRRGTAKTPQNPAKTPPKSPGFESSC